jgi:serine O-acetyltransferase
MIPMRVNADWSIVPMPFRQDLQRWIVPERIAPEHEVTWGIAVRLLARHMPVRAMLLYRISVWANSNRVRFVAGFCIRRLYRHHGLEIWSAQGIGGGLYLPHPIGSVIAAERIGSNCTIIGSVTIGMRKTHGFPRIGDDVFIGAGARVLGAIEIGNGARIGANAVVLTDIPAYATAVGNPARVLRRETAIEQNPRADR